LIGDFVPAGINQLWTCDITYWMLVDHHTYINFIKYEYSNKIVSYQLADAMEAFESLRALQMTISVMGADSRFNLIHHSDVGVQYCG